MARIPDGELERLKQQVSLVRVIKAQGHKLISQGISYEEWRRRWIDDGMIWDKGRTTPPVNWDPTEQVRCVVKAR